MATAREAMEEHLQAALKGDLERVASDVVPELTSVLQQVAPKLGDVRPTSYEILGERQTEEGVAVKATLIGESSRLVVEDTWKEIEGVWKVVKIQPLEI